MTLDREQVVQALADVFGHTRFAGATFRHDQRPTAQVFPEDTDINAANKAFLSRMGIDGEGIYRLDVDREGAWLHRRGRDDPELIPFGDLCER